MNDTLACLDDHDGDCEGTVEYRFALSGTGINYPRCDKHWDERLTYQRKLDQRYPDSPNPPSWFDPTYAGESWDDET